MVTNCNSWWAEIRSRACWNRRHNQKHLVHLLQRTFFVQEENDNLNSTSIILSMAGVFNLFQPKDPLAERDTEQGPPPPPNHLIWSNHFIWITPTCKVVIDRENNSIQTLHILLWQPWVSLCHFQANVIRTLHPVGQGSVTILLGLFVCLNTAKRSLHSGLHECFNTPLTLLGSWSTL